MADPDTNRAIGALEATVKNLTDTWIRQDAAATEGRREMYRRFDKLSDQFAELKGQVTQAVKDIAVMQPAVRLFQDGKLRSEGAWSLGKTLWAIIIAAAGAIGWAISEYFKGGVPPHH